MLCFGEFYMTTKMISLCDFFRGSLIFNSKGLEHNMMCANSVGQGTIASILHWHHMCWNLAGSVRSPQHWLWDIARKKWISIVFYCSENPPIAHNLGTAGPIQVGFSAKCTSPNEHFNQKLKMSHVRVPTDFPRSHHILPFLWAISSLIFESIFWTHCIKTKVPCTANHSLNLTLVISPHIFRYFISDR